MAYLLLTLFSLIALSHSLPFEVRAPDQPTSVAAVPETPEESFQRSDGNQDKNLTFDEFLHSDLVYEQLKKDEFNGLDANHDGVVSKNEYDTHYQKEKESTDDMKAEYFGQIFEEFDENFDLKLSKEELEKVLRKRFVLSIPADFDQIFKKFDENNDGGLDLNEYMKMDSELDFSQFEPIPSTESPTVKKDSAEPEQMNASSEDKPPILAFKTEKMPMMKRKFLEKY